jgi:hypothetical protein
VNIPDDVRAAAEKILAVEWANDVMYREGGALLWASAESYTELLSLAATVADWIQRNAQ